MAKIFAIVSVVVICAGSMPAWAGSYSANYVFRSAPGVVHHARSEATKFTDLRACGASRDDMVSTSRLPSLLRCMQARGWVVAHVYRHEGDWAAAPMAPVMSNDQSQADDQTQADDDDNSSITDEEEAQQQSDDDSAAATQAMVDQENEAADAQIAADTEAQAQAQSEAASLAADQPVNPQ
jgi:hypothetical protein